MRHTLPLRIAHSALRIPHCAFRIVHYALCIVFSAFCILHSAFCIALVGFHLQSVLAATLSVPGDYATIQAAIDASVAGDTVVVADGFVCDSGSQALTGRDAANASIPAGNARLVITKGITLTSSSGTTNNPVLVVGRTHSDPETATVVTNIGPDAVRCLYVKTSEGERAVIRGFAFTGGNTCGTTRSANGKSDATSYVARGGGVWCDNCASAPLIENCLLTNNVSYYLGGALYGPAVASNCLFRANRITYATNVGGGAAAYGSDICTSLICGNTSAAAAGAVRGGSCTDCVIRDNTTTQNQTSSILGGIVWDTRLVRCLIKGNAASGAKTSCPVYGGTLVDCDFQGNSGGTVAYSYSNGTAYNCRFYGPASGGKPHIANSTLHGCVVSNLHLYSASNLSGGVVSGCTAYNTLFYDLLTNKSSNQSQYQYGAQLVNSKLFNCTMVILASAYPKTGKTVSYNAVYGCQLVNTVLVTPAGFGTSALANFSGEACGTIVATNSCMPAIYRDGGKLTDNCRNIFVGDGEAHSTPGVLLEGDRIFQLTPQSPCRNAGWDGSSSASGAFPYLKRSADNPAYGFDFAGNRRVSGGTVDIGAFESQLLGLRLSLQ